MKQSTIITKIVMFLLLAAVVFYLAISAVQSFLDPFSTTVAYMDILDDAVEITGVVVRDEQVLYGSTGIMDILPDEGERVAAGETVAVAYQSQDALERKKQLQALELEVTQLEYALKNGGNLSDAAKLEQQIISSLLTIRANTAAGDLSSLESDALTLRTQVLQRDFAYSASGDSAVVLEQSIAEREQQILALNTQLASVSSAFYAPRSGLFSGRADGLEGVLTPAMLKTVTPDVLNTLPKAGEVDGAIGKLITGDAWYFAAVVKPETAKRLRVGDTITVAFSMDYTGEFTMTVDRVGPETDDGCVLILSAERGLKEITLLREQTVHLVFTRYTGIRIPKQALHMETVTFTDPDTKTETETQVLGVYAVVGAQAQFKPVKIVREGSDYYLITPAADSDYFRTVSSGDVRLHILRSGDEVIVTASDLYDGKVVLE